MCKLISGVVVVVVLIIMMFHNEKTDLNCVENPSLIVVSSWIPVPFVLGGGLEKKKNFGRRKRGESGWLLSSTKPSHERAANNTY